MSQQTIGIGNTKSLSKIDAKEDDNLPPIIVVQDVLAALSVIYSNFFAKQFSDDNEKTAVILNTWREDLRGMTPDMIKKGLKKCRDPFGDFTKYAPTSIEFGLLCLPEPEDLGIPDVHESFKRHTHEGHMHYSPSWGHEPQPFSHEIIRLVIERIGWGRLKNMYDYECWKIWCDAYDKVLKDFMRNYYYKLRGE